VEATLLVPFRSDNEPEGDRHFRFDKLGVSWQPGSRLARAAQTLSLGRGKETSPGSDQRRYRLSSMGSGLVASADCSFPTTRAC
jgi:hypothetical protein